MSFDNHQAKRQRLDENGASSGVKHEDFHDDRPQKYRDEQPNKVLLFTIMNAVYPITTDILHTICEPCGEVLRIVIFRKRGVQAMVEFNSIQTAQRAKVSLNGADIYSGCCTLKIEWAKPTSLNVHKNDEETWDYTINLDPPTPAPALLGDAPAGFGGDQGYGRGSMGRGGLAQQRSSNMGSNMRGRGMMGPRRGMPRMIPPQHQHMVEYDNYGQGDGNISGFSHSPVLMVYGLHPEKMNCERVFNLLCLYGNVMKVKFLKSKPGTAMVQMGDPTAVDRAINNLSGLSFYGEKLTLAQSKQMYLNDTGGINDLSDGTPNQMDFANSRNNRFMTSEQASKNRIQRPAKVLHYYNAPIDFDDKKMEEICEEFKLTTPTKFTPFKSKSERSSSGLMEFEDKVQAMEALTMLNHYKMENPNGRFPYVLKLCFSTANSASSRESRD